MMSGHKRLRAAALAVALSGALLATGACGGGDTKTTAQACGDFEKSVKTGLEKLESAQQAKDAEALRKAGQNLSDGVNKAVAGAEDAELKKAAEGFATSYGKMTDLLADGMADPAKASSLKGQAETLEAETSASTEKLKKICGD
jgi:hypothetical protein